MKKEKITMKQQMANIKSSMLAPQPAPYIVDAAAKYGARRKKILTQADIGLLEAQRFTGYGRYNDLA